MRPATKHMVLASGIPFLYLAPLYDPAVTTCWIKFALGSGRPQDSVNGIRASNDAYGWITDARGTAVLTDGVADFVEFPADAGYLPTAGATVCQWDVIFEWMSLTANDTLWALADSVAMNDADDSFNMRYGSGEWRGRIALDDGVGGTISVNLDTATPARSMSTLYHMRMVLDGSNQRLFLTDMATPIKTLAVGIANGLQNSGNRTMTFGAITGPAAHGNLQIHEAMIRSTLSTKQIL